MKVAIVGCGLMGSCSARELALRGHEVTGFEQFEFGHTLGSSHGESRIVRKAYPDGFYTELLLDGYPLWHEIEKESEGPFLHEVGLLYLGNDRDPEITDQMEALERLGVPFETKREGETPFAFADDDVGVFTPEAGWVHAPTVLKTVRDTATKNGAKFVHHKVESLGELREFDRVVVTAGAWVRDFADVPVSVRQATFAYIEGAYEGPVFIEARKGQVYGFPNEERRTSFKIGCHDLLREIDPDAPRGGPDPAALDVIRDFCARRLEMPDAKIVEPTTCLYTRTKDEDFRFGMIDERTVVASPCSGHGFKFGPWVGRLMADVCEGRADLGRWPRFSL
ncbi:MAG TPA: FAD-dependent oxidoreductase [Fimbriimonadaceae bacterium]|nr:FAD-dependent oxidoreductase [Fimbriimonadaceae bacterium]